MSAKVYRLVQDHAQLDVRIDDDFPPLEQGVTIEIAHRGDGGFIAMSLEDADALAAALAEAVETRRRELAGRP